MVSSKECRIGVPAGFVWPVMIMLRKKGIIFNLFLKNN
jgi:hypothetical protein